MKIQTMRDLYEKFNQESNSEPSTIEEIIVSYLYNIRYSDISISNLFATNYLRLVSVDQYIQLSRIFLYVCDELNINKDAVFQISTTGGWLKPKKISKRIIPENLICEHSEVYQNIIGKIEECEIKVIEEGYKSDVKREYFYFIPKED